MCTVEIRPFLSMTFQREVPFLTTMFQNSLFFYISRYPVIISLENHCSVAQQIVMAKLMREILKNILL